MEDRKKKLYKLDDIGIIGTQEKISPLVRERIVKKTGEFIRAYKAARAKTTTNPSKVKKAS